MSFCMTSDETKNIYLGYDSRERQGYLVARNSIERRASIPVLITPLHLNLVSHLIPAPIKRSEQMWDIESDAPQSTEFARSRFCIPKIQRDGWCLFADSDILCLTDIKNLFDLADDNYAVMVVKHKHEAGGETKMDGQVQTYYERKNWSSVILFNCSHPAHYRLTDSRLNMWPGRDLHAFKWLQDDEIGELSPQWNHLVGIDNGDAHILHFTLGTPDMQGYENCDFADLWHDELQRM